MSGSTDSSVEVKLAEGLYIHWFEEKHNGRRCIPLLVFVLLIMGLDSLVC